MADGAANGLGFDEATRVRCFVLSFNIHLKHRFSLQKELETFMDNERAQARVHSSIHNMTSMCWDKYVFPSPTYSYLGRAHRHILLLDV